MATVSNAIKLNDSMGSVLKSIVRDMDMTIGTMERLDSISNRLNLGSSLNNATASASGLHRGLDPIDNDIRRANEEQKKFNNQIRDGTAAASQLRSMFSMIGGIYAGKQLLNLSDSYSGTIGGLENIKAAGESAIELNERIFASAQRARASYLDTASAVTKLGLQAGQAFSGVDEITAFTELMNKNFAVGRASAQAQSAAMYQLTQAMASGRLQGDEYRSIIENAPLLARSIETYMKNAGVKGAMKEWAADGLLTADVIKAAMFSSADEVEARFAKLPITWGQLWNVVTNNLIRYSQPLLNLLSAMVNNWSILGPIIYGVVGVLILYGSVLLVHNAHLAISNGLQAVSAARAALAAGATLAEAAATTTATGAQVGFNAALMACPITWIIIGLIALVAIFYAGVAAVNKFAGTTYSATGLIMGAFFVLGAFIFNNFIAPTWNAIAMLVNFFANVWNDPIGAVELGFYSLAVTVIGYIVSMANAIEGVINKIPGVKVNITGGLDSFYSQLESAADKAKNQFEWVDYVGKLDTIAYGDAWKAGNNFGSSLQDKVSGMFGSGFDMGDFAGALGDQEYDVNVKDDVNLADESMEYLMDAVMQRYVNNVNVTAPAPNVQVLFTGEINRDVDLDELAEKTKKKIGTEIVEYAMSSTDIKR